MNIWTGHLRQGEEQREVKGWRGYYVTNLGRVFSFKMQGYQRSVVRLDRPPVELIPVKEQRRNGNRLVPLRDGRDRRKVLRLAAMVAEAFIGARPNGLLVCHKDDDQANNAATNLYYGTQRQNVDDAMRNGRVPKGQTHTKATISDEVARQIRESELSVSEIVKQFSLTRSMVESIKREESWAHVGGTLVYNKHKQRRAKRKAG